MNKLRRTREAKALIFLRKAPFACSPLEIGTAAVDGERRAFAMPPKARAAIGLSIAIALVRRSLAKPTRDNRFNVIASGLTNPPISRRAKRATNSAVASEPAFVMTADFHSTSQRIKQVIPTNAISDLNSSSRFLQRPSTSQIISADTHPDARQKVGRPHSPGQLPRRQIMKQCLPTNDLAEHLRSAQPRLICRVDAQGSLGAKLTPYIRTVEPSWQEIIEEGYDPDHSPLGCPVYYRVVKRGHERFYCTTFLAPRAAVLKGWGDDGLAYCDPVTGLAVVLIETNLDGEWPPCDDEELKEAAAFRARRA
jgi:hypothetical protein